MPTFKYDVPANMRTELVIVEIAGETFRLVPEAPAAVINAVASGIKYDEVGNRIYSAPSLISFMLGVIVEEIEEDGEYVPVDDHARFMALMQSKTTIIPIDLLGEMCEALGRYYGRRPTSPSSLSAERRRPNGTGGAATSGDSGSSLTV